MAKILCLTSSQPALLYPGVELARRLARAGHRLTYASSPDVCRIVEHHGIDFLPLEPSRYETFLAADAGLGAVSRLRRLAARRRRAMESLGVSGLARAVGDVDPDLILIEGEMHEHIIVASSLGVPIVLLNSFVSIWRQPRMPPPHCAVRPGVGWWGSRVGISLLWAALRLRKLHRAWSLKVRRVGCDRLSLLRGLAAESGFDFDRETDAGHWLIPFTYKRLPVFSMHAEEFEFPHRPLERVRYVGPLVLEERDDERITDALEAELRKIFESSRRDRRALIFAGFGSHFTTDLGLVRRLIAAVEGRRDWQLMLSLGGRLDPGALGPLPERVHVFGWLPQVEVLRHADVAVIHGGITTVDECVLHGVPMLVYCGAQTDMAGTAARVVHHRIGIAGDRQHDAPGVIRERLDRLLRDPVFGTNLARLREHYEAYAGERVVERAAASILAAAEASRG